MSRNNELSTELNVRNRVRMRMSILLSAFLLALSTGPVYGFDIDDLAQFVEGRLASIHSKGHPNSDGLSLSLTYPMTWEAHTERDAPVVAEMISRGGSGKEACSVSIVHVASPQEDIEIKDDFIARASNDDFSRLVPEGYQLIAGNSVSIDDSPALQLLLSEELQNHPESHRFYALSYVYVDGRYVIVNCGTLSTGREQALFQFKNSLPVFAAIANSIKVHNRRPVGGS